MSHLHFAECAGRFGPLPPQRVLVLRPLREPPRLVREHDLHTTILLLPGGSAVGSDRVLLAETLCHIAVARHAALAERLGNSLRAPLRQLLVVCTRSAAIGMALDENAYIGIVFQVLREPVESAISAGLQRSPARIEEHIAERHDHPTLSLLRLQVLQLLPRVGKLTLRGLGRILRRLRLAPGGMRLALARFEQGAVALLLRLRDLLPRM